MEPRMNHPVAVVPGAMEALQALSKAATKTGVPFATLKMVDLRASQINGCSFCVEMHARELRKAGESEERIATVAAWREAPWYSDAERAALALTEAVTRIADRPESITDEVWADAAKHYDESQLGGLLITIGSINVWNRLNAASPHARRLLVGLTQQTTQRFVSAIPCPAHGIAHTNGAIEVRTSRKPRSSVDGHLRLGRWRSAEVAGQGPPADASVVWIASSTISATSSGPRSRRRGADARTAARATRHCSATACWRSPEAVATRSTTSCRRADRATPASATTKSPAGCAASGSMSAPSCCVISRSAPGSHTGSEPRTMPDAESA